MKLATHLHLVLRLRICGAIPPFSILLHGVVLSQAQGQLYVYLLPFILSMSGELKWNLKWYSLPKVLWLRV